ncbi:MAG TPA: 3'-5' exonuclease, partial [Rubrivivax sp.]|nr:3'-5' exonuclease [Rubrivivax sp.]
GHDLSLAQALKSPLFGASDDDLLWLSQKARELKLPWLAALAWVVPPSQALLRARGLLAGWCDAAGWLPPHDLIDRVVAEGELLQRLAATVPEARRDTALHAVQSLLHAALAFDGGRYPSLYGFVRELKSGRAMAPAAVPSDAVQLLTVHGAKGLEARAVFIIDADSEVPQAERATLLVDWPVDRSAPRRLAFIRSEARVPASLAELFQDESTARHREEINGLYVAMTRAREWLFFSRTEPQSRAARTWWQRVERLAQDAPAAASPATVAPLPTASSSELIAVPVLPTLKHSARSPGPVALPFDPVAARLGQAVHRVLEWAAQPGAAALDLVTAATAAVQSLGLPTGEAVKVASIAGAVLSSPACGQFFSGAALRWAANEVPVADAGETLRIDRLVALAGPEGKTTWWVLDYKLQLPRAALPAYHAQLRRYVAAVRLLQPTDEVRAAFITGQGELVELPVSSEQGTTAPA